jgi:2-hydroxy-3-oxopropionate reductase
VLNFALLGLMGAGMATRLLQSGFQVTVYNRTHARAEALVGAGGLAADTPRDAVKDADVDLDPPRATAVRRLP